MEKDFQIRLIEQADNPVVARIIRQVMTEFDCVGEGYSLNDPEVQSMYEAYQGKGCRFFVLTQNGEVVGCGGIAPLAGTEEAVCELRKMYFLPVARGHGMGKRMIKTCLQSARELGYQKCYLETVERMVGANALYKKMGFEQLCSPMGNTGHGSCDTRFALTLSEAVA